MSADPRDHEIEALRDRLSRLSAAGQRINQSLDFDQVLQGVLDSARSLASARYAIMTLLDEGGGVRRFLASGFTPEEAERLMLTPDRWRLFEALTDTSEPLRLADLEAHVHALGFPDFTIPMPVEPFSFLAAPMLDRGARLGHIFVGGREDGAEFSPVDEETLALFAAHAALVIANAGAHREERRARADLETLIDTSPVGVAVLDAQTGQPISFNREARRLVSGLLDEGQEPEAILEAATCVRADGREISLREYPMAELLTLGEPLRAEEVTLRVPDGRSATVLLNSTPIEAEDGELASVVVTMQDLAPLAEQERLRAEFLAMVSHELRTPLAAVKGSVATLLEGGGALDPAETGQFHRIIRDQTEQMRELIGDLLDLARIETGALSVEPEPVDLRPLLDEAASRIGGDAAAHPLRVEPAEDLPLVMADRRRVLQVLGNLLANAVRHSPDPTPIVVEAVRDGDQVAVSVADQGRGIPAAQLPKLFRKFSPDASGDGSGLGLAICKGIVEAHGGRIRAESEGPGLGARFTFTLPAAEAAAAVPTASSPASRRRVRVLAVDDNPQDLRYVRDVLNRAGYAPIVTADPEEAPRLMADERPQLVLLDLIMPGKDGIELMHELRKIADVPIIFLSVYGQDETIARAFDMGAVDYVVKPFSPTELAARLRAALRRRLEPEQDEPSAPYAASGLSIDYARRRVALAGEPVELTATEYAVLYELAVHAPRVLTHATLLQRVWGPERIGEAWLVRNVVKRLRSKLGDDAAQPTYIFTEPRVGYYLAQPEPPEAEG